MSRRHDKEGFQGAHGRTEGGLQPEEVDMVAGDSDVDALCREMLAIENDMLALHQRIKELAERMTK